MVDKGKEKLLEQIKRQKAVIDRAKGLKKEK